MALSYGDLVAFSQVALSYGPYPCLCLEEDNKLSGPKVEEQAK